MKLQYRYYTSGNQYDFRPQGNQQLSGNSHREILLLALASFRPKTATRVRVDGLLDIRLSRSKNAKPRQYTIRWYNSNSAKTWNGLTFWAICDTDAVLLALDTEWDSGATNMYVEPNPDKPLHGWILYLEKNYAAVRPQARRKKTNTYY